jgi:hypothetical protein
MTFEEYQAIEALNWSTLKLMGESPKYLQYQLSCKCQDTQAFRLGRAIHYRVLESDFENRYVVMPDFGDMRSSKNRDIRDEWIENRKSLGDEVLTADEYQAVIRASDAVLSNPEAMKLLEGTSREHVITWDDDGILCKGRLDAVGDGVIDLKTTRRRSIKDIIRDAATFDYHAQCAWYHDGAKKAGLIDGEKLPVAIFVHFDLKSEFTDVIILDMNEAHETLSEGRAHYQGLLDYYRGCKTMDNWPGVAPRPIPWTLPRWKTMIVEGE